MDKTDSMTEQEDADVTAQGTDGDTTLGDTDFPSDKGDGKDDFEDFSALDATGQGDGDDDGSNADDDDSGDADSGGGEGDKGDGKDVFPSDLVSRAESLGLDQDELVRFSDPGDLTKFLDKVEAKLAPMVDAGKGADASAGTKKKGDDKSDDEFSITLDPDLYDPAIVETLKGMKAHNDKELAKRDAEIAELRGHFETESVKTFRRDFDSSVSGLAELSDVLGKGETSALDPKSKEFGNRMVIAEKMDLLRGGYIGSGKPVPDTKSLFKEAVSLAFPDHKAKAAQKALRQQAQARSKGFTARPTAKTTKPTNPDAAAEDFVESFLSDHGVDTDDAEAPTDL